MANSTEIYENVVNRFMATDQTAGLTTEQRLAAIDKEIAHAKEEVIAHQMHLTSLQQYRHEIKFL